MDHPPYSPDLSPCDFWLFKLLKKHFRGKKYKTENELALAVNLFLAQIPEEEFAKCIKIWFERMEMCVQKKGGYFEMKEREREFRNR